MICYRDMTFCSAKCATVTCRRNFTEEEAEKAKKWWGDHDFGPPVAFSDFSANCPEFQPIVTDVSDDDDQLVGIMP